MLVAKVTPNLISLKHAIKKPLKEGAFKNYLVAGAGFEPTTFGL
jgi:hypothetical protein